ncbi:hypothetical protein [Peijinzhouia sedimentorum]
MDKPLNTAIRYNELKKQNEVNCIGYFNCEFFTALELKRRQDDIYKVWKELDGIEAKKMTDLYDVTEFMRVQLLGQMVREKEHKKYFMPEFDIVENQGTITVKSKL